MPPIGIGLQAEERLPHPGVPTVARQGYKLDVADRLDLPIENDIGP
jgi:hypothetical protein